MDTKYTIISPVRNEAKHIEETIRSVIAQTILPQEWIIVNDGSTDNTAAIVEKYLSGHPWIKLIHRPDRGFTQVGKGVIEAFNYGFRCLTVKDWEFIVKLDCDVRFERNYFEDLLECFSSGQKTGILGPTSFFIRNGTILVEEKTPIFHPWAGARMYRRKCFEQIGGLVEELGWDTMDILRAQMHEWETRRLENAKVVHLRRMASRNGLWEGKLRMGKNFYITGYHPLFLIARSIYRLKEKPYFVESAGVICGYLKSLLKREPLVVTKEEKKFLRKQQIRRLFGASE